jgi:O-antigen/teichoic acid export membrane protein
MTATATVASEPARRLRRDVVVFGGGMIAGQALSAATTPLLTRALGPADFGVLDVLTVVTTLAMTVLLGGFDQAITRAWFDEVDPLGRRRLVTSGLLSLLLVSTTGVTLAWLALRPGAATTAALAGIPFAVGFAYVIEVLRVDRQGGPYATAGLIRGVTGAAIGVALAVVTHHGVAGVLIGLASGSAIALAYACWSARHLIGGGIQWPSVRRLASFGVPLIPAGVAYWSLMVADRLLLVHMVPAAQVGYYALANKVALLLLWIVYGFRAGWTAGIIELHSQDVEEARRRRAADLTKSIAGVTLGAAALGGVAAEAIRIGGGDAFAPAARVVPVVLVGLVVLTTTVVVQSAMLIHKRTSLMAKQSIVSAIINLALCLALIPPYGAMGAAIAGVAGFTYLSVATYVVAQRIDPVPYAVGRTLAAALLVVPYLVLGQFVLGPLLVSLTLKAALLSPLALLVWRTNR